MLGTLDNNPLKDDLDHILAHTEGLWGELKGKRLFITGGTGFFGCWLLESFLWANEKLDLRASATVLTRDAGTFAKRVPHLACHPSLSFHSGDVGTFIFPQESISYIIHASNEAAGYGAGEKEAPAQVRAAISQAAKHTLDFARACGARNFLFTSSGSVYGPQPAHMAHLTETHEGRRDPAKFRFAHGEGKFIAETLCADYAEKYGIAAKIARCFTFVGPYMQLDANYAIGNFIRDGLRGGPIIIRGDSAACRSYMYAADLVVWLWTILLRGDSLRPYNVGSMEPVTIGDVAALVSRQFTAPISVKIERSEPARERDIYVPDTMRAQNELRLCQYISLPEAVKRTITFFKAKPVIGAG